MIMQSDTCGDFACPSLSIFITLHRRHVHRCKLGVVIVNGGLDGGTISEIPMVNSTCLPDAPAESSTE